MTSITAQRNNIAEQKADIAEQKADITAQKADIAAQKNNIAEQKADITAQRNNIAEQKADIVKQKAYIRAKTTNIQNLKENISILDTAPQWHMSELSQASSKIIRNVCHENLLKNNIDINIKIYKDAENTKESKVDSNKNLMDMLNDSRKKLRNTSNNIDKYSFGYNDLNNNKMIYTNEMLIAVQTYVDNNYPNINDITTYHCIDTNSNNLTMILLDYIIYCTNDNFIAKYNYTSVKDFVNNFEDMGLTLFVMQELENLYCCSDTSNCPIYDADYTVLFKALVQMVFDIQLYLYTAHIKDIKPFTYTNINTLLVNLPVLENYEALISGIVEISSSDNGNSVKIFDIFKNLWCSPTQQFVLIRNMFEFLE
jgi:hypothetical protein